MLNHLDTFLQIMKSLVKDFKQWSNKIIFLFFKDDLGECEYYIYF